MPFREEKPLSDLDVTEILVGRGVDREAAEEAIAKAKSQFHIEIITTDILEILVQTLTDESLTRGIKRTASSGRRKFGEKNRIRRRT